MQIDTESCILSATAGMTAVQSLRRDKKLVEGIGHGAGTIITACIPIIDHNDKKDSESEGE